MPSSEISTPKLLAREIAAFNDADLDQYLEQNSRFVDVQDPENLPDDFIQRLKDRTHGTREWPKSQPIDLDQVTARLQEQECRSPSITTAAASPSIATAAASPSIANAAASPSIATAAASPTPEPEEQYRKILRIETGFYQMLLNDGGRPSHPLSRLEEIIKEPGEYDEILLFWHGLNQAKPVKNLHVSEGNFFLGQVGRWQDFRGLQRFARGQRGYDYWRSRWEDTCRVRSLGFVSSLVWVRSEEEWEDKWHLDQKRDNTLQLGSAYISWELFTEREEQATDQQGFPEYAEALKGRLVRHSFTRTFELDEDVAQQDQMTTWIEYLGYEYWWYDRYADTVGSRQKWHDKAWSKLVDSKVLRPGEDEETIRNIDTIRRDVSDHERAEMAVRSAMLKVSSAETDIAKSQHSRHSLDVLRQRLLVAQSELEILQMKCASLRRRLDCITEFNQRTRVYNIAKKDAKHHELLLRWMLQQVPLIEREMHPPRNGRTTIAKRHPPDGGDEQRRFQKQRRNQCSTLDRLPPTAADSQRGKRGNKSPYRLRRTTNLSDNVVPDSVEPHSATGTGTVPNSKTTLQAERRPRGVDCQTVRRSVRVADRAKKMEAVATATAATLTHALATTPSIPSTPLRQRTGKQGNRKLAKPNRTSKPQGVVKKKGRTRL